MRHATMPDVVVKLMEARARVAKGWCQGQFTMDRPERYCALGALPVRERAARSLLIGALPIGYDVASYNDEPERTQADILALFDRAIEGALR